VRQSWDLRTRRMLDEAHVDTAGVYAVAATRNRVFVGCQRTSVVVRRPHQRRFIAA
jgi:hypothetical protein